MSLVMRKPAFCICENKDTDQRRGNRLSSNCEKSDKNWSEGYIQMSCTSSVLDKNNSKVSKGLG